ncbi:MAG TPA: hypothetical protein VIR33_08625 [Thermopolyspora sp.]|jgi:hypothetical protein
MDTAGTSNANITPELRKLIRVLAFGALAPALDTTIVNIAIGSFGREPHASVDTSQWIITGYLDTLGLPLLSPGPASIIYGLSQVVGHDGFADSAVLVSPAAGLALTRDLRGARPA